MYIGNSPRLVICLSRLDEEKDEVMVSALLRSVLSRFGVDFRRLTVENEAIIPVSLE